MFAFDRLDAKRIAISAAGALFFSAICVGGAVAPAQAAVRTDAVAAWHVNATRRLDRVMAPVVTQARFVATRNARIGVTVDDNGTVRSPAILQSSGNRAIDARLLRRAAVLKLAPMPDALAATHQPVELEVILTEAAPRTARIAAPVRYAAK